jgi:chlorite dismutase
LPRSEAADGFTVEVPYLGAKIGRAAWSGPIAHELEYRAPWHVLAAGDVGERARSAGGAAVAVLLAVLLIAPAVAVAVLINGVNSATADGGQQDSVVANEPQEAADRPDRVDDSEGASGAGSESEEERAELLASAEAAAESALSYDYRSLDSDRDAALQHMTESYGANYRTTFDQTVAAAAEESGASSTAIIQASGITAVGPDEATLLLFIDQTITHSDSEQPRQALNRVTISMVREGETWLVDDIQSDGTAEPGDSTERDEVMLAAERFTEMWNTFSASNAQGYVEDITPLLTTKFRTEFTDAAADVVTGIESQQLSSDGTVLQSAVAAMDADSAVVLVSADVERSADSQSAMRHWRWRINLVRVEGQWLVDGFEEV